MAYSLSYNEEDNGKTIQLGIYDDASNTPGTLLASTTATVVNNGWNTLWLNSPVYLVDGTRYWLGYMYYDAGYSYAYISAPTLNIGYYSNAQYSSLPASLAGGMTLDHWYHPGIYANTCP